MSMSSKIAIYAIGLASFAVPVTARADVPPPDACMNMAVGDACTNAGPNADQPGTCTASTCSRSTPDGSVSSYDCVLCMSQAGTGGSGGGGGSSGSGGSDASATGGSSAGAGGANDKDNGGCSCNIGERARSSFAALVVVALSLLTMRRRRGDSSSV